MRKLKEFAIVLFSISLRERYESSWRREVLKIDCMSDVLENGIYREELGSLKKKKKKEKSLGENYCMTKKEWKKMELVTI